MRPFRKRQTKTKKERTRSKTLLAIRVPSIAGVMSPVSGSFVHIAHGFRTIRDSAYTAATSRSPACFLYSLAIASARRDRRREVQGLLWYRPTSRNEPITMYVSRHQISSSACFEMAPENTQKAMGETTSTVVLHGQPHDQRNFNLQRETKPTRTREMRSASLSIPCTRQRCFRELPIYFKKPSLHEEKAPTPGLPTTFRTQPWLSLARTVEHTIIFRSPFLIVF